jgi:high affinity Mn2+ porin
MLLFSGGTAGAHDIEDWNLKLQSTYVWQGKPAFTSPYEGEHSLKGASEKSYSLTATAAFGLRLGANTELYVDPELAQGVPLSGLVGLAGFTNGEMARTSGANPTLYRARLFARHVIALGDDTEDIEPAMNQLGSTYAKRRVTLTVGNLSVLDVFDANQFSHDPRTQFLNLTLMTHGAYDFAADARGYTWGLAAEVLGDGWALRAGRFIQPKEPNQLPLDSRILRHYGDQIEVEHDYELGPDRPGTVRVLAYRNRALMSRYDDALALADATGSVPSLDAVRSADQSKVGLGVNVEQTFSPDLGAFARAMWADGKTETYAFTEADRSMSIGAVLKGARWDRAGDAVGVALAGNLLSASHRAVLARGGLTFFLGDGRLNYASEQIFETYYAWSVGKGLTLSFDFQRIRNPGYNADRGPASFFALRAHIEN